MSLLAKKQSPYTWLKLHYKNRNFKNEIAKVPEGVRLGGYHESKLIRL
jgi:hypothetical protein